MSIKAPEVYRLTQTTKLSLSAERNSQLYQKQNDVLTQILQKQIQVFFPLIKIISNFRSLVSLLMAYQDTKSVDLLPYMREISNFISQDQIESLNYLINLNENIVLLSQVNALDQNFTLSLNSEIQALLEDSKGQYFAFSPTVYLMQINRQNEQLCGNFDFLEILTQYDQLQIVEEKHKSNLLQQQLQQLQASFIKQEELMYSTKQQIVDQQVAIDQQFVLNQCNLVSSQANSTQMNVRSLEDENQNLRQVIDGLKLMLSDLRKTTDRITASNQKLIDSNAVAAQDNLLYKQQIELYKNQIQKLQQDICDYQSRKVEVPHLTHIQEQIRSTLEILCKNFNFSFQDGPFTDKISNNLTELMHQVSEFKKSIVNDQRMQLAQVSQIQRLKEDLLSQQQLVQKGKDEVLMLELASENLLHQNLLETSQNQTYLQQNEYKGLQQQLNKLQIENNELKDLVDHQQKQISMFQSPQHELQLKQMFKQAVERLREQIMKIYQEVDICPEVGTEFDFTRLFVRLRDLKRLELQYEQYVTRVEILYENQKKIEEFVVLLTKSTNIKVENAFAAQRQSKEINRLRQSLIRMPGSAVTRGSSKLRNSKFDEQSNVDQFDQLPEEDKEYATMQLPKQNQCNGAVFDRFPAIQMSSAQLLESELQRKGTGNVLDELEDDCTERSMEHVESIVHQEGLTFGGTDFMEKVKQDNDNTSQDHSKFGPSAEFLSINVSSAAKIDPLISPKNLSASDGVLVTMDNGNDVFFSQSQNTPTMESLKDAKNGKHFPHKKKRQQILKEKIINE